MTGERVPVLLISGCSRSGATLLAQMLAGADEVVAPGELRCLWQAGILENRRCDCGELFFSCPFWRKTMERGLGGPDAVDPRRMLRLQADIDRVWRIPALISTPEENTAWELAEYLSYHELLYRAIVDVSGARVVVDSSKEPSFGHVLARSQAIDLSVVHLVRDSRAVSHSRARGGRHAGTEPPLPRQPPWRSALEWDMANLAAGWLARRVARSIRLRYEDLACDPEAALAAVLELIGVRDRPPLEGGRVPLGSGHALWSAPTLRRGSASIHPDEDWQTEMADSTRALVTALTWPGLLAYGYSPAVEGT
ncbi:MAG: sulfotransferase [Actinomycetota bacterium]